MKNFCTPPIGLTCAVLIGLFGVVGTSPAGIHRDNLIASGGGVVGHVESFILDGTLFVDINTTGNYTIDMARIAVGQTIADIPIDSRGNPLAAQFPFVVTGGAGMQNVFLLIPVSFAACDTAVDIPVALAVQVLVRDARGSNGNGGSSGNGERCRGSHDAEHDRDSEHYGSSNSRDSERHHDSEDSEDREELERDGVKTAWAGSIPFPCVLIVGDEREDSHGKSREREDNRNDCKEREGSKSSYSSREPGRNDRKEREGSKSSYSSRESDRSDCKAREGSERKSGEREDDRSGGREREDRRGNDGQPKVYVNCPTATYLVTGCLFSDSGGGLPF